MNLGNKIVSLRKKNNLSQEELAEKVAKKIKAKIIINGESIGQVASQTLTSMYAINNVTNMPIIRPVSCLDKLEIMLMIS